MRAYLAVIDKGEGTSYGVTFPDLPGCTSAGYTAEEAMANAVDALTGHLAVKAADGDPIPEPRSLEQLRQDPAARAELEGGVLVLVPYRPSAAPKLRINVMMDQSVLRDIDQAAEAAGISRSAFIERAVRGALGRAA